MLLTTNALAPNITELNALITLRVHSRKQNSGTP